jgi:hypothetical protein
MTGCVDINGGAVEVAWTVIDPNGDGGRPARLSCEDQRIARVYLVGMRCDERGPSGECCASLDSGVCTTEEVPDFGKWDCDRLRGTTGFDIPTGTWALGLRAECQPDENGVRREADVRVPDPIVRDIVEGEVAQLDALMIAVPGGTACD